MGGLYRTPDRIDEWYNPARIVFFAFEEASFHLGCHDGATTTGETDFFAIEVFCNEGFGNQYRTTLFCTRDSSLACGAPDSTAIEIHPTRKFGCRDERLAGDNR